MKTEYAIMVLQTKRMELKLLLNKEDLSPKQVTKIKHKLGSIKFAIEVLEEYLD